MTKNKINSQSLQKVFSRLILSILGSSLLFACGQSESEQKTLDALSKITPPVSQSGAEVSLPIPSNPPGEPAALIQVNQAAVYYGPANCNSDGCAVEVEYENVGNLAVQDLDIECGLDPWGPFGFASSSGYSLILGSGEKKVVRCNYGYSAPSSTTPHAGNIRFRYRARQGEKIVVLTVPVQKEN